MEKRIKSFLITASSIFMTAFATLIFTPEWADFVDWLASATHNVAAGHGVPTTLVIVIGLLVSEVWKQLVNMYILNKRGVSVSSYSGINSDLY